MPQQAALQYGPGNVDLRGKSMSLFVQDDWRKIVDADLQPGLRYELLWPFTEKDGQMVNLDVGTGFLRRVAGLSGETGPFRGTFPKALMNTDINNVAPRVGVAWRFKPGTILRGGYGVSYNPAPTRRSPGRWSASRRSPSPTPHRTATRR